MSMNAWIKLAMAMALAGAWPASVLASEQKKTPEWWQQFSAEKKSLYTHMQRHGINAEDVYTLRRLFASTSPNNFFHYVDTLELLKPGEHYRIQMDQHVLTMVVPDERNGSRSRQWISPYNDTRTPEPGMARHLEQEEGALRVANMGWHTCRSLFPPGMFGSCEVSGVGIVYSILRPENAAKFSNPETLRQAFRVYVNTLLPTREDIEATLRGESIIDHTMTRIAVEPELVTLNGRIWLHYAMDTDRGREYAYITRLGTDRVLSVRFGLPRYNYRAEPDPARWPGPMRRGYALMQELRDSLRIARLDDDSRPDPFVVYRVEPAPLPVREPLPAAPAVGHGP